MKTLKFTLMTIFALILLSACSDSNENNEFKSKLVEVGSIENNYDIVKDIKTGCVYILYTYGLALKWESLHITIKIEK